MPTPKQPVENKLTGEIYHITKQQAALLGVFTDPKYFHLTNKEKTKIAGVDESTLYNAKRNPDFIKALRDSALNDCIFELPAIMRASINVAKKDSYQGHADRKMLLSAAGLVTDKREESVVTVTLQQILKEIDGGTSSIPAVSDEKR